MKTLPFAEARAKLSLLVDRVAAMDEEILIPATAGRRQSW